MNPPCVGKWALFDSPERDDHQRAKAICDTCPMIQQCRTELAKAQLVLAVGHVGPTGTWAGMFVGPVSERTSRDRARMAREESIYDDTEAKAAHAAYVDGTRGAWAETGQRVYDRRIKRARRAARSAA